MYQVLRTELRAETSDELRVTAPIFLFPKYPGHTQCAELWVEPFIH